MSRHLATSPSPSATSAELVDINCARARRRCAQEFESSLATRRQAYAAEARKSIAEQLRAAGDRALADLTTQYRLQEEAALTQLRSAQHQQLQQYRASLQSKLQEAEETLLATALERFSKRERMEREIFERDLDRQLAEARTEALRELDLQIETQAAQTREIVEAQQKHPVKVAITRMPKRKTKTTVKRDASGNVAETIQTTEDA